MIKTIRICCTSLKEDNLKTHWKGQAFKGTGRMPWHQEPTKDVTSCEKLRGGANNFRSADIRMGEPTGGKCPGTME